jgi:glutamate 5-kinase
LEDTENRRRWLNCSSTLRTLLQLGAVPLINENASIASDEIRYGDNDRLAARTAQMVEADLLVLLSDIDGLYSADPGNHPDAIHFAQIDKITPEIEAMAGGAGSVSGSGGMATKLMAAKIAGSAGCATLIIDGREDNPLQAVQGGKRCTLLLAQTGTAQARKNWIAGTVAPKGKLVIDAGAQKALSGGASLLAAGIIGVHGRFERGEVAAIVGPDGQELARGRVSYDSGEISRIQGLRSDAIAGVLGYDARKAVVHRDNLVETKPR